MRNKNCSKCKKEKPVAEFSKDRSNKSGLSSACKKCHAERWAAKPGRPRKGRKPYEAPKEKLCKGCDSVLPADAFWRRPDRGGGKALHARCKTCCSSSFSSWSDKNPGASRKRNLMSKYELTQEKYMEILESQGDVCGICGSPDSRWKTSPWLHVDHDHETGVVRGMLCHPCNIMIGALESIGLENLEKVAAWVEKGTTNPHDHQISPDTLSRTNKN